jgi:predicted ATPase
MARLIVKNIGPIKYIDIELKKVNVFMGPQGCGKSTLAKIISFCSWMEKGNDNNEEAHKRGLVSTLTRYHRLEGYFREDSELAYVGDNVNLYYQFPEPLPLSWKGVTPEPLYHDNEYVLYNNEKSINPKVAYIPAERNFVSVVPNLNKYSEKDDSLQSFVNDWFEAKRSYTEENPLKIAMLGVAYYYNAKTDSDFVVVDGQKIRLNQSSSGFQSIVPLMVLLSYLSTTIYEENKPFSPAETEQMREILSHVSNESSDDMEQKVIDRIKGFLQGKVYTHTQFVIEEPEQNLFPDTQCNLMYHLLNCLNHGKAHRAVITTHSPYILYALNNCMLANIIKGIVTADELEGLQVGCANVYIRPEDVAVWEIENGAMKTYNDNADNSTIQDKEGLIRKNFFNHVMGKVMGDFNNLLMYKD